MGPSGDPGERPTPEELTALRAYWSDLLTNPDTSDPRAGGFVFVGGTDVADIVRDGLRLLDRIAELEQERDAAREVAEASAALHAEDALPGGKVFSDAYARWVTAVEAWTEGAALRAGG